MNAHVHAPQIYATALQQIRNPNYWIAHLLRYWPADHPRCSCLCQAVVYCCTAVLHPRRYTEKTVGYCESHDQALVGDKTIAFRWACKNLLNSVDKGLTGSQQQLCDGLSDLWSQKCKPDEAVSCRW